MGLDEHDSLREGAMQLHLLALDPMPTPLSRDDRYTPAWLVTSARQALGQRIALDPASSHAPPFLRRTLRRTR
jgi:hypothetical protein